MGASTDIAWANATFNAWWGCVKVSPACDSCYAEAFSRRVGQDLWGKDSPRRFFSDRHWDAPLAWDRRAERSGEPLRVFCSSMSDVFEANDEVAPARWRLWSLIERTPHLTWQLLTKRPENVRRMVPLAWLEAWPANVWLGATVEDNRRARIRIPRLLAVPAAVRWLSCEPLLEDLELWPWLSGGGLAWVICGGESGPHRRPMDLDWARRIRDDCAENGVAFFFKQVSSLRPGAPGPDDLMVRQFPAAR